MARLMTITAMLLVGTLGTAAQSPPPAASAPAFEVASIRRNVSADQGGSVRIQTGGALTKPDHYSWNFRPSGRNKG